MNMIDWYLRASARHPHINEWIDAIFGAFVFFASIYVALMIVEVLR